MGQKYYQGTITSSYVSERPLKKLDISNILDEVTNGTALAGKILIKEAITAKAKAVNFAAVNGSPGFFNYP